MRAASLNWRTVTAANDGKFLVKGTELSTALYGRHSRFQICEIRCMGADGFHDRQYYVRDAHGVTDAQMRDGVRPPIVARLHTLDGAMDYCDEFTKGDKHGH